MTLELSMSSLERAMECPASLVLPQSPNQGAWASYGHVVHAFLQRVPTMGREAALAAAPEEHREALDAIDTDAITTLDADGFAYEVAIAFDLERGTARELGRGIPREEAYRLRRPGEVVGTLDVLGCTPSMVIVVDYKSGFRDLGPVKDNWQLRGYALLAARLYEKKRALVGILRPGALEPYFESAELTEIDLDVVEDALQDLRGRYDTLRRHSDPDRLPTRQGRWCTYCPAFAFCPGKRALVAQALQLQLNQVVELREDNVVATLERVELLEEVAKKVREALEEYVQRIGPVDLGGGWVYGQKVTTRRPINVERGLQVLLAELGEDVMGAIETTRSLTQADLKRLVSKRVRELPKGERPAVGHEVRRIMGRLAAAKALDEKTSRGVYRHKPPAGAIPAETEGEASEAAAE